MGGAIALDAALLAPDTVAGLVLIAPAVSGAPEDAIENLDPDTRRIVRAIMAAEQGGDIDAVNRHEVHLWLDGPSSPEGRVRGAARELALAMNEVALRSGAAEDAGASDVGRMVAPGGDPRSGDGRLGRTRRAGRGGSSAASSSGGSETPVRRSALPGVAHLPALERPDLVVDLVADATGLGR